MPPSKPETSESESTALITGPAAFAAAAEALLYDAQREIALISYQLPTALYGSAALCETIKQRVLAAVPRSRVRVLLNDPKPAATGHRLVELGRHLSSYFEFRQLHRQDLEVTGECLIVDQRHVLERATSEAPHAIRHQNAPPVARERLNRFQEYWDRSEPATELRRLHLG